MTQTSYDAIVVGSGIAGGWAAKELTEKGLKTLVLERGRMVTHGVDYVTEHEPPWAFDLRGYIEPSVLEKDYPILSRASWISKETLHFFQKDAKNPYIEDKPFTWIRGDQVGGKSLMWGLNTYRISDIDFEANVREGVGVDWPIRYADIAPWYSYVEKFAGISGEALGLPHLPDSEFQKPVELNVAEKYLRDKLRQHFPERYLTICRAALLTEAIGDRRPCHFCGPCARGCSTGSYFSSQSSTLPAASATGNLTIRPFSVVHSVIYDEATDRATGVRVIDSESRESMEFHAKVIFLCASTLGSTQILLNSKTPRFSQGLGNSSGQLGHNLMDHHSMVGAFGRLEGYEDRYHQGNRPIGFYIPRFRNISPDTRRADFLRGYGFQGVGSRDNWRRGIEEPGFGVAFKERLRRPGPWQILMIAYGEVLPRHDNMVRLDDTERDPYGIPKLRIRCTWGENELAMRKDMVVTGQEMLERAGFKDVFSADNLGIGWGAEPGHCMHEMGTARMGRDPKTSVLNAHNQLHDVSNVFVTDGACMTSSPCQNPSLTYMALTARAADHAVSELKRGNL